MSNLQIPFLLNKYNIFHIMTSLLATKLKVATLLGSNLVHVTGCPDFILAV